MRKEGRGKSTDPAQEALREQKAKWNKNTSDFISDVINLKKMMNGWPSKFSNEKSKIQEPLPEKVPSVLSLLALEFKDLAQSGQEIVSKQLEYSKNRKQKLSNPIIASSEEYGLYAFASNPLTRFWSRIKNITLSNSETALNKKHVVSLLTASADIYKDILNFQEEIVKSTPESIFIASKLWIKIKKRWDFVDQTLKGLAPTRILEQDTTTKQDVSNPLTDDINKYIDDANKYIVNFLNIDSKKLDKLIYLFNQSKDNDELIRLSSLIKKEYLALLQKANEDSDQNANSFKELMSLKKVAENVFNKWIGKLKHQISPFDKTSSSRLEIYKSCNSLLSTLDNFMDILEKGLDISKLLPISSQVISQLNDNFTKISRLEKTLEGRGFENEFINLLDKGELSEYDIDFDKSQRERLQKSLELKRFRELGDLYQGKSK